MPVRKLSPTALSSRRGGRPFRAGSLLLAALLAAVWSPAAEPAALPGVGAPADLSDVKKITDLNGRRLGVIAGTMLDNAANDGLDFTQIIYFDNQAAELVALVQGEIDAIVDDEPVIRFLASRYPSLRRLEGSLQEDNYGFAMRYGDDDLYAAIDTALREFLADGTVAALGGKWLDSQDDALRVLPDFTFEPEAPVLRYGTSSVSPPFSYVGHGGGPIGFEIELMSLIALRLRRRLAVTDMEFSELIPALQAGNADIISSCLSITEDRKKIIHFTTPYYRGGIEAVVHEPERTADAEP